MTERIENLNVRAFRPLKSPDEMKATLPLGQREAGVVLSTRDAVRDLLHGRDRRRLLVVVGPCSIHDPEAALEYAARLQPIAEAHRNELLIAMRTYFEKPRTSVGWKGFLNDPHLDGSLDMGEGIRLARELLVSILGLGLACGTELLDPITPQYLSDLLTWSVIGARTTESQTHRGMASGLSMPVAFKNGTDGSLDAAVNAMEAVSQPHGFLGIDAEGRSAVVETLGNPDRHLVLRGGRSGPNYDELHVAKAAAAGRAVGIARPVMVDCSHDNSGKDHTRQGAVCRAVLAQVRAGDPAIVGLMVESNLEAGRQDWQRGVPPRRGVSITDACIGFAETEQLLGEMAEVVLEASGPAVVSPEAVRAQSSRP